MTSQEMRNALYQKKATDLLRSMVALNSFKDATGGKIPSKRMTDCDFANRFLAFYLCRQDYDGNLDGFMGDALEKVNKMSQEELGRRVGRSKSVISSYENNIKIQPLDVLVEIALVFNVSLDYLVGIDKKEMISANGLSERASELAEEKVLIPMAGEVESLNAAVAAALLMYESFRKR